MRCPHLPHHVSFAIGVPLSRSRRTGAYADKRGACHLDLERTLGDGGSRHRRGLADGLSRQEREMADGDIRPNPCLKCGNPSRLFTPNAQRVPYASPRRYEAAWQCTTCGHLSFLLRDQMRGRGVTTRRSGQRHRTDKLSTEDFLRISKSRTPMGCNPERAQW